jgi:hypothetical protein
MTLKFWKRENTDVPASEPAKLPAMGICEPYYLLGEKVETRSSLIVQ